MIKIIPYVPAYQQAVIDLIVEIQREEFGFAIDGKDQPDLSDVKNFYQVGCGNFWLALSGEQLVGTIALRDIGNQQVALRKMFVNVNFRGREYRVAALLLETLMAYVVEKSVREIFLGTTEKFQAAHRFYEKHGFDLINPDLLPNAFPRMAIDTRFYVYRLS